MLPLAAASLGALGWAYLVCLLLGLFYGLFAGLFSLVGGHFDMSGHDVGGGHAGEVSDMGHDPGAADTGMHMSPFSPVVLSIFLVSFGGTGLSTMQLLGWQSASLAVAAPSGFVMAAVVFLVFQKIFSITQGSSEPSQQECVGKEAEVITPIPADGLGEIAYNRRGSRFTATARCESGAAVAKQSVVTITRVVGHTFYVKSPGGPP